MPNKLLVYRSKLLKKTKMYHFTFFIISTMHYQVVLFQLYWSMLRNAQSLKRMIKLICPLVSFQNKLKCGKGLCIIKCTLFWPNVVFIEVLTQNSDYNWKLTEISWHWCHGSALLTALSRAFDWAYWNSWTLDAGLWTLESGGWTLDSGLWTLDSRLWMLHSGLWTLDSGRWTLDAGPWTLDATLRKLGSGYQTLLSDDSEQNQNPVSSSSYSREYSF